MVSAPLSYNNLIIPLPMRSYLSSSVSSGIRVVSALGQKSYFHLEKRVIQGMHFRKKNRKASKQNKYTKINWEMDQPNNYHSKILLRGL